jgi:hypothetical protein
MSVRVLARRNARPQALSTGVAGRRVSPTCSQLQANSIWLALIEPHPFWTHGSSAEWPAGLTNVMRTQTVRRSGVPTGEGGRQLVPALVVPLRDVEGLHPGSTPPAASSPSSGPRRWNACRESRPGS